ncbi:hypothetical protein NDU88_002704 [Pleurodeles waltl]|uniref:Uncharacterized protein n=1 Tax=Pleurodeles waltl TaxID=8319 RepID=A0AAV7UYD9_PLEWA|nr:hypothetical protein NDU88_002704 [Pleurodeles waltl]
MYAENDKELLVENSNRDFTSEVEESDISDGNQSDVSDSLLDKGPAADKNTTVQCEAIDVFEKDVIKQLKKVRYQMRKNEQQNLTKCTQTYKHITYDVPIFWPICYGILFESDLVADPDVMVTGNIIAKLEGVGGEEMVQEQECERNTNVARHENGKPPRNRGQERRGNRKAEACLLQESERNTNVARQENGKPPINCRQERRGNRKAEACLWQDVERLE